MMKLPRESFVAIAAVAWADGILTKNEAESLLDAARQCGLAGDDLAVVEKAVHDGASLDGVELGGLSDWERGLTYALSCWLARVDGVTDATELSNLRALGERLGIPKLKLQAARSAVMDVAALSPENRPAKFEFTALAERLGVKLPSLSPPPKP